MFRHLTVATLAVVAFAFALASQAEAGASASAPSKYSRAHHQAANQQASRNVAITEYSSSSARRGAR
jgi:acid phosphatase class B